MKNNLFKFELMCYNIPWVCVKCVDFPLKFSSISHKVPILGVTFILKHKTEV